MAIKVSILKALICQGGPLAPWTHPADFGGNGYNAEARALAAGTTLGALTESGFALQSETYGRAFPDRGTELSDEDKRANAAARKRYADVHGGTTPSIRCRRSAALRGSDRSRFRVRPRRRISRRGTRTSCRSSRLRRPTR